MIGEEISIIGTRKDRSWPSRSRLLLWISSRWWCLSSRRRRLTRFCRIWRFATLITPLLFWLFFRLTAWLLLFSIFTLLLTIRDLLLGRLVKGWPWWGLVFIGQINLGCPVLICQAWRFWALHTSHVLLLGAAVTHISYFQIRHHLFHLLRRLKGLWRQSLLSSCIGGSLRQVWGCGQNFRITLLELHHLSFGLLSAHGASWSLRLLLLGNYFTSLLWLRLCFG